MFTDHQRRAVNLVSLVLLTFTLGYQIGERITDVRWIRALTEHYLGRKP